MDSDPELAIAVRASWTIAGGKDPSCHGGRAWEAKSRRERERARARRGKRKESKAKIIQIKMAIGSNKNPLAEREKRENKMDFLIKKGKWKKKEASNEEWITRQLEHRPRNLSISLCGELRRTHDPWLPRANQRARRMEAMGRGAPGALSLS